MQTPITRREHGGETDLRKAIRLLDVILKGIDKLVIVRPVGRGRSVEVDESVIRGVPVGIIGSSGEGRAEKGRIQILEINQGIDTGCGNAGLVSHKIIFRIHAVLIHPSVEGKRVGIGDLGFS